MMRTNIGKYNQKYDKLSDLGSQFGAMCLKCSSGNASACDLLFGNSGGVPLGPTLALPGTRWSDFLYFLDEFRSHCIPNVKDYKATFRSFVNKLHQSHLKKTSKAYNKILNISLNNFVFTSLLLTSLREVQNPRYCQHENHF